MTDPIWHNADDIRRIAELEAKLSRYEAATVVEGFKCLGCGHVYMGENVSECDCTVHSYNYQRVRVLIMEEEG